MISPQDIVLRLLVALLFCGAVGVERYLAGKSAGIRTHVLVGVGSALFTIVSGYAFHASAANADRIAAQIVSGIGFIGGGAILKERGSIKGLTTAAGLWAVAALGMAAGAGMFAVAGFGTIVIMVALVILHRAEKFLPRRLHPYWAVHITLPLGHTVQMVRDVLHPHCLRVSLVGFESDETIVVTLEASLRPDVHIDQLTESLRQAGAIAVAWDAHSSEESETAF